MQLKKIDGVAFFKTQNKDRLLVAYFLRKKCKSYKKSIGVDNHISYKKI
jgi:hypothetical protein